MVHYTSLCFTRCLLKKETALFQASSAADLLYTGIVSLKNACMLYPTVQLHFKGLLVLNHTFDNSRKTRIDRIIFACINPQDRSYDIGYSFKRFLVRPIEHDRR